MDSATASNCFYRRLTDGNVVDKIQLVIQCFVNALDVVCLLPRGDLTRGKAPQRRTIVTLAL